VTEYRVRLAKETFKFSSTHFTLFNEHEAERLHGHNYHVTIECGLTELGPFGMGFEFNELKPLIKELTEAWDERILVAQTCPHIALATQAFDGLAHVSLRFGKKHYLFPESDVALLPIANVTSEELAKLFAVNLAQLWKTRSQPGADQKRLAQRVGWLDVQIEETRGQSATYRLLNPLLSSSSQENGQP
jgi:6-pyruvoyltetrahydropterin/6-carboxytetrahydropterin synthase